MSIHLIQDRLQSYQCRTSLEEEHAIREITQEVILAALSRTDFFKHAVFQGGTCLRIFYGLNRFSEDLDFLLTHPNASFTLAPYIKAAAKELTAYGYEIETKDRSTVNTTVQKAFMKDTSAGKLIELSQADKSGPMRSIRVKLEVDTNPPDGSEKDLKYIDFPFVSQVSIQSQPSLFAGKLHALLCRKYVKGRDWYDFLWYTGRQISVNLTFFLSALNQFGPWKDQNLDITMKWCRDMLKKKINAIDWKAAVEDVSRFVKQEEKPSLKLWCSDLFLSHLEKMNLRDVQKAPE